ncbi:hypothetical protein BDR07DRAFT_1500620 [Suillus spraguei]|nr:hypothetical protein BDR07DRAFT_1500620 [Suillus spraguei]
MTIVSNNPTWWPIIDESRFSSYFSVAAFAVVTYDWGQENWSGGKRWSLMTIIYLGVRYLGILDAALAMLDNVPTILLPDTVSLSAQMPAIPSIDRSAL